LRRAVDDHRVGERPGTEAARQSFGDALQGRHVGAAVARVGGGVSQVAHHLHRVVGAQPQVGVQHGEVDALVARVTAAGGTTPNAPVDHGFMYQHGFADLDGHQWEVFWMDESAAPPQM